MSVNIMVKKKYFSKWSSQIEVIKFQTRKHIVQLPISLPLSHIVQLSNALSSKSSLLFLEQTAPLLTLM